MRVRRLEARDKPVWLGLFKGYIEFYKATVPEDVIETTSGQGELPHSHKNAPPSASTPHKAL